MAIQVNALGAENLPSKDQVYDQPNGATTPLSPDEKGAQPGRPGEKLEKDKDGNVYDMSDPAHPQKVGKIVNGKLERDDAAGGGGGGGSPSGGGGGGTPAAPATEPPAPPAAETEKPFGNTKPVPPNTPVKGGDGAPVPGENLVIDENNVVWDIQNSNSPKKVGKYENGEVVRQDQPTNGQPGSVPS